MTASPDGQPGTLLAPFVRSLEFADVPAAVQDEARRAIIDTLACAIAGAKGPLGAVSRRAARVFGGNGGASAAGVATPVTPLAAAYVNARTANAMDFDETFPVGAHFGVGALAAALAVCETEGSSSSEFLSAFVVGYEVGARVATAIGPMLSRSSAGELSYPRVWGAGGPVVMASAAAAVRARRLDAETALQALVLAASMTPIPTGQRWSSAVDLPNCKYVDAGWCAQTGIFAVEQALAGGRGHPDIFDDDLGYFAMLGAPHAVRGTLTNGLGSRWYLPEITYKLWPSCRWTHYPLTALKRLLAEEDTISADSVESIEVLASPLAFSERFTKTAPRDYIERQYSFPHVVAAMLLGYPPARWLDDDTARAPELIALRERVTCALHPRSDTLMDGIEGGLLKRIPGGVRVRARGRVFEAHSDLALGDPWSGDTFASDAMLADKITALAGDRAVALMPALREGRNDALDPPALGRLLREGARDTQAHK